MVKKFSILTVIFLFIFLIGETARANSSFKFPKMIQFKMVKNDKTPFQGKEVSTYGFAVIYKNSILFRLKVFKDNDGYCFPVNIRIVKDFTNSRETLELRADRLSK